MGMVSMFVLAACGSGGTSDNYSLSCKTYEGTYTNQSGTCPAPFSCTVNSGCLAECSDGSEFRISMTPDGFTFTSSEGAYCSATLQGSSLSGTCTNDGDSCTFASVFTPAEPDDSDGASNPVPCSLQVQTGTRTECDWSYGISDPDIACSEVPVYSNVDGVTCNAVCTDTDTDSSHCGACNTSCTGDTTCQQGSCVRAGTGGFGGGASTGGVGAGGSGSGGTGAGGSGSGGTGTGGTGTGGTGVGAGGGGGGENDPCSYFPDSSNGYACGANLGGEANVNTLYYCNQYETVGAVTCKAGCHASSLGTPDYCNDSDPCANSPWSNKAFCGAHLSPLANPNRLYVCENQVTIGYTDCQDGCFLAPYGETDLCYDEAIEQ